MVHDHHLPPELRDVAARLQLHRPKAAEATLHRALAQARGRAGRVGYYPRRRGILSRPRLAVAGALALGVIFSGGGTTLAVVSDGDSAAIAQYPGLPQGGEEAPPQVLGEEITGPGEEEVAEQPGEREVTAGAPARQREAAGGGGQLPVTGMLAIPVVLAGLGLLAAGLMLRRIGRRPLTG